VTKVVPLTASEDALLGALLRIASFLPKRLDADLIRSTGLTANEYCVLRILSEAPTGHVRMADLAHAVCVSPSRMSRLVDDLHGRGFVEKKPIPADGRGYATTLTAEGLRKLKAAWPAHIASLRGRIFDHLDPKSVSDAVEVLSAVAAALEDAHPITKRT
jgi:DNA-binding MarR family transcriptional regulator